MYRSRADAAAHGLAGLWDKVMSGADAAPAERASARPSKYKAVRTEYRGLWYDSKAEAARAAELDVWAEGAPWRSWERQPRFRLGLPECVYVADFLVLDLDAPVHGRCRVEDVKGHATAKFKRDVKLWMKYGKYDLWVITGKSVRVVRPERVGLLVGYGDVDGSN